ncbi:methyltransferase domain-containing protein [Streptomyces sp. LHD-70]|uniref:methyltransferase domain-containing protein n=1 Tax=Streptomyces sp. LHD-70 TaxID=3072140 RepID=UPI0028109372|nr:methyltransferase domain-containing protein [Streptomyces sp. LHD-70]MDQ8701658.1 methyltransferase domain-containing protein [Streptomyces sp. LHD-70]
MTQTRTHGYLLDPRPTEAGQPFDATAALFDASTFRHFERIGVGPGWRCWEVGAGGPTVLAWLAKRVGPTGRVVGTDLDISRASAAARPPVEVRCHDVSAQEPPGEGFDLVHARLVLSQVTDRDRALHAMVRSLRPGGRLLIEDADDALQPLGCPEEHGPAQQLANHVRKGLRALLTERGADPAYGRRLPRLLREAGLVQVEAEAYFPLTAPAAAALETAMVQEARDRLVARSLVTGADIDRYVAQLASGTLDLATSPLISAWGRKA